uniref:Zinc finger MYM-type protein 4-like n=1 Tax=Sphaeramia orbicularis TaxID=375764 RepID=A0A673BXU4_9TELE
MADSEEFRLKRIKEHEERLSRVFDEVMGLGDFADSSRGSATSSRSGPEETKGGDETSGQEELRPVEEQDSNGSRQEEKIDEGAGESSFPRISSPSSEPQSSFTMKASEGGGGGGGSGGAANDNAMDAVPSYGTEEEEEDWHFALPVGSMEDGDVGKTKRKRSQPCEGNSETQSNPFPSEAREEEEEEEEREREESSANTSHSSQDQTPENSQDGGALNQREETEDSQQGEEACNINMASSMLPCFIGEKLQCSDDCHKVDYVKNLKRPQKLIKIETLSTTDQELLMHRCELHSLPEDAVICLHHKYAYLDLYPNLQKKCCNPFNFHDDNRRKSLRTVTLVQAQEINQITGSQGVKAGMKLCPQCRKKKTETVIPQEDPSNKESTRTETAATESSQDEFIQQEDKEEQLNQSLTGLGVSPCKIRKQPEPVQTESDPPMSPNVNIKEEPIDEGYDAALLPQSSIRQIKEELDQEEELRISSVYSVGGGNTFATPPAPVPVPPPPPAAIFIPGRGAVLQAMAPLPIRPPVPVPSSIPALAPIPPRPPQPPIPGSVRCSGCSKVLLKGQTAFQRKGSTQLFCSTVCLTGHLPPANKTRSCFQCNKEIVQPKDMITIPTETGTFMNFCGQFCLSVYRHKKKTGENIPEKWVEKRSERKVERPPEKPVERQIEKPFCSVCRITSRIEHEVSHQGRLHRLCSDACFVTWRKMRQLAMNCCEGCGLYCNSSSGSCQTLTIERSELNFCGPTCISTYKQSCRKTAECAFCHKVAVVSSTILERDQKGKIQLYCSPVCVEQSRPPRHTLSDTPFPCSLCKTTAVPQYHLAMVDGTIRNFCSFDCVSIYRKSGHASQPDLTNGTSSQRDPSVRDASRPGPSAGGSSVPQDYTSSVPYRGHHPSHTSVPPLAPPYSAISSPSAPGQGQARTPTSQHPYPVDLRSGDASKVTCHQCCRQFSSKPQLLSHQGRISMFCSNTCGEHYKTQKNILATCESCKQEKVLFEIISYNQRDLSFCSENCKQLFKHDATSQSKECTWRPCSYCSSICTKMLHSHYGGKMEEFCKPHCMSQYTVLYYGMGRCDSCRKQGYMTEKLQCLGSVRNFCNLPCLLQYCYMHFEASQHSTSNGTCSEPPTPYGALPTSNADGKNLDHASTQTDAMRVPASRRRQMKNKSVLCRPFNMDQEIMCQLPVPSTDSAGLSLPSLPGSTQEENVKLLMVPVPVPVFIPVPMNMYTQHTPTPMPMPIPLPVPVVIPPQKKEVKDAAVQSDILPPQEEKLTDQPVSSTDQSTVDSQTVSNLVNKTDETESPELNTQPEKNTTTSDDPSSSAELQPPSSPMMDLESDFPSESLDQTPSAPQQGVKRPRESYPLRKKGRRRTGSVGRSAAVTPPTSKLNHLYGVKAWRNWVQQLNKQPPEANPLDVKEDILQCDSAELSFALCRFITEVRRPSGETYSPDSIFYLCLGIQQYLFMKGRIENIFTDQLYSHFASEITGMLQLWKPKPLPSGSLISSRVEESYLWECKQLGAYSPIVLLNTLLFFCTKNFHFTTLQQHQTLSFSNFTLSSKPCSRAGKVHYLHFQRSSTANLEDTERSRKRQREEEEVLEMLENNINPLHCPVRLYEFYLSRCPETVKKRTDMFYLQPEQNVNTQSPYWYTPEPLERTTLQNMLTRILAVREAHQKQETGQKTSSA